MTRKSEYKTTHLRDPQNPSFTRCGKRSNRVRLMTGSEPATCKTCWRLMHEALDRSAERARTVDDDAEERGLTLGAGVACAPVAAERLTCPTSAFVDQPRSAPAGCSEDNYDPTQEGGGGPCERCGYEQEPWRFSRLCQACIWDLAGAK